MEAFNDPGISNKGYLTCTVNFKVSKIIEVIFHIDFVQSPVCVCVYGYVHVCICV